MCSFYSISDEWILIASVRFVILRYVKFDVLLLIFLRLDDQQTTNAESFSGQFSWGFHGIVPQNQITHSEDSQMWVDGYETDHKCDE